MKYGKILSVLTAAVCALCLTSALPAAGYVITDYQPVPGEVDSFLRTLSDTVWLYEPGATAQLLNWDTEPPKLPADNLRWTSSDENVAVVSDTGVVTAVGTGVAVLVAEDVQTHEFHVFAALCNFREQKVVTGKPHYEDGALYFAVSSFITGLSLIQLGSHGLYDENEVQEIVWSSSDETKASVDETGLVSLLESGDGTVIVTQRVLQTDGSVVEIPYYFRFTSSLTYGNIMPSCIRCISLVEGQQVPAPVVIWPYSSTDTSTITYPKVASFVRNEGEGECYLVQADSPGSTFMMGPDISYGYFVTVYPRAEGEEIPPLRYLSGDVNLDDKISVTDLVMLARLVSQNYADGCYFVSFTNADFNQDGSMNATDISALSMQLACLTETKNQKKSRESIDFRLFFVRESETDCFCGLLILCIKREPPYCAE